jgi:7-carboxy-7-deazaguanine synthase
LKPSDEIKFVICSRADFDWAVQCIAQYQLQQFPLIFSPSYHQIQAQDLAEWLLQSGVPARMQVQLHKILWGEKQGV